MNSPTSPPASPLASAVRRVRSVAVVVNPAAGGGADLTAAIEQRCLARVDHVEVHRTGGPGDAERIARAARQDRSCDVVAAVGGDGTAHEVAAGLALDGTDDPNGRMHATPALLTLPAGTGNSFHREIWADLGWEDTLEAALDERRSRVRLCDLGRMSGSGALVLLGASSGLVADALVTARDLRETSGRDRYDRAVAATLRTCRPYEGQVTVDGTVVHRGPTVLVNVGGGRYRGGRHLLLPYSVLDDGLLDVCVIDGAVPPSEIPGMTTTGRHVDREGVVYARGRTVTVERTDGHPLSQEHDGEVTTTDEDTFVITVLPRVLPVLAPAGNSAGNSAGNGAGNGTGNSTGNSTGNGTGSGAAVRE